MFRETTHSGTGAELPIPQGGAAAPATAGTPEPLAATAPAAAEQLCCPALAAAPGRRTGSEMAAASAARKQVARAHVLVGLGAWAKHERSGWLGGAGALPQVRTCGAPMPWTCCELIRPAGALRGDQGTPA